MQQPKKEWKHWPPLPSTIDNPIGIDGVLESVTPPYVKSMDAAVDQILEEKYGPAGTYGERRSSIARTGNRDLATSS